MGPGAGLRGPKVKVKVTLAPSLDFPFLEGADTLGPTRKLKWLHGAKVWKYTHQNLNCNYVSEW